VVVIGGVLIGLLIGWLTTQLERYLDDTPIEITFSFLTPFAAYIPAEALGVSGVLAVVVAGLYAGRRSSRVISPASRLQAEIVWNMVTYLMNGLLFILIGLQLRTLLDLIPGESLAALIGYGALISLAVILVRLAWVFPGAYLPRYLFPKVRKRDPYPSWHSVAAIGWMGMRGVLSLAAALSLPMALASGARFTNRPIIIFLTFCVILATLVGQGLTLPAVIRWLKVGGDDSAEREEQIARLETARAAIDRIGALEGADWVTAESIEYMRSMHEHRAHRYDGDGDQEEAERDRQEDATTRHLKREVLDAERSALIRLRDSGTINDMVLRRIERELDLQETWLQA
jgi:Na+/H+ antiporter